MTFKEIQDHIRKGDYLFSDHADEERTEEWISGKIRKRSKNE